MLSVAVTTALAVLDSATLKRAPESFPPTLGGIEPTVSSAWSVDNRALYLLSAHNIRKHDPTTSALEDVYAVEGSPSHIVAKDKGTLIFSDSHQIHVLQCGADAPTEITQTFTSHKSAVTSLSLCNDLSLLASTSSSAVHVYNLVHGSHTVLRSLPLAGQTITTAAFHRHSRTHLLIAIGKQLVVFDTTRPSAPLKTIPLGSGSSGDIIAVACSPFSKTLVAVATSAGNVGLVDLEKEKGLFRTLNLKAPLTSLSFSPEGASIYVGTETGKLLIIDLRSLDKPPKCIVVSEGGDRVECMSVQAKLKVPTDAKSVPSSTARAASDKEKPVNSPAKTAKVNSARKPSLHSTPSRPSAVSKKIFSPVKESLGNKTSDSEISLKMDVLSPIRATSKKAPLNLKAGPVGASLNPPSRPTASRENLSVASTSDSMKSPRSKPIPPRTRTVSTLRKAPVAKTTPPTSPGGKSVESLSAASTAPRSRRTVSSSDSQSASLPKAAELPRRTRTISTSSRVSKAETARARSPLPPRAGSSASRTGSDTARPAKSSVTSSAVSPLPPMLVVPSKLPSPPSSRAGHRTPSPDLPDADPMTPLPQKKGMAILGLDTPDVERWIQAGDKKRSVGFLDIKEDMKEKSMEIQVSPRRSTPMRPTSWASSPLRNPASPGTGSAHEFLRGIVDDVLFEYQKETKAQLTGLHLEMMSMRRGWRKELGEVMEQYVGDLKDLRDENKQLRDENERLRRGY